MLDLKGLAGLQAQRQQLDEQRHSQSETYYQKGLEAFARASNSDFQDRDALKEALEAWIQAIKHQRGNPAPYISLGYLFTLLDDKRTAMMYLKTAQRLDPKHPDPPLLIDHLLGTTAAPAAEPEPSGDDDHALEDLQRFVSTWIGRLSTWPAPVAALSPEQTGELQSRHDELRKALDQIHNRLIPLEADFDLGDLRSRLRPLEQRLKAYTAALQISQDFMQLAGVIDSLEAQVRTAMSQGIDGRGLDNLLDACDGIADQIDEFENRGHTIDPLVPLYKRLVAQLETLQDKLDEG